MRGGRPGAGPRGGQAGIDFAPTTDAAGAGSGAGSGVIKNTTVRQFGNANGFAPDFRRSIHQASTIPNGSPGPMVSQQIPHTNRMYLAMFYVNTAARLKSLFNFTIADDTWQWCIYSAFGIRPGFLLWDSGLINRSEPFPLGPTNIYRSIPVDIVLQPGWYFFGSAANDPAATSLGCSLNVIPDLGQWFTADTSPSQSGMFLLGGGYAIAGWTKEIDTGEAMPETFPLYTAQSWAGGFVPFHPQIDPVTGVGWFSMAQGIVPSAFAEWEAA